jgi:hypothetical protein
VQRLETALAELPVGRITSCLPGNDPPPYDPGRMLDFKPGKAGGWSTAHSVPPDSDSAVPGHRSTPAGKARHLDCAAGRVPAFLLAPVIGTSLRGHEAAAGGCGAWVNIVLVVQPAQEPWMNCPRDGGGRGDRGTPVRGCRAQPGPPIHLSVHELVDDLCKKAASLCAGGEILGIAAASRG